MCSSKCQGACKSLMNNNDCDPKESLPKIIIEQEKITECTISKPSFLNSVTTNYIIEKKKLKVEAKQLSDKGIGRSDT